jgi:hypothetical protein
MRSPADCSNHVEISHSIMSQIYVHRSADDYMKFRTRAHELGMRQSLPYSVGAPGIQPNCITWSSQLMLPTWQAHRKKSIQTILCIWNGSHTISFRDIASEPSVSRHYSSRLIGRSIVISGLLSLFRTFSSREGLARQQITVCEARTTFTISCDLPRAVRWRRWPKSMYRRQSETSSR